MTQKPKGPTQTFAMILMAMTGIDEAKFNSMSALSRMVLCRKLEKIGEAVREGLIPFGNREYQPLIAQAQAQGLKVISVDGAVLKKYTPRTKWEYPANVTQIEDRLKQAKKVAEADGTAVNITPVVDPTVDCVFSISV
jgi:hypothetical protein